MCYQFLDYLRSALDTRSAAATRVAEINEDGVECRAFLPGSPALWGWTTNLAAEAAVLQAGIEVAIQSSIFDSPAASCSKDDGDIFVGVSSSHPMGGATLRDIYAKAWEVSCYNRTIIRCPLMLAVSYSSIGSPLYGLPGGLGPGLAPRLGL